MMHEFEHHFFQLTFPHLPVADDHPRARRQPLQFRGDFPDRIDAVVHEINLASAVEFLLDRRLNQFFVPTGDYRLDRHAIFGRSLDHAHVAQPDQATCAGCAEWA